MTVDINDVLGSTHDSYLQIIKVQTHEIAVLKAQLAAATRPPTPKPETDPWPHTPLGEDIQ